MNDNKPYINDQGDLIVPFECSDNSYKYWKKEGKSMEDVLEEIAAPPEVRTRYLQDYEPGKKDDA